MPSVINPGVVLTKHAARQEQSQVELMQKMFKTHDRIQNFFTIKHKDMQEERSRRAS